MTLEQRVSHHAFLSECQPPRELTEILADGESHVISFETPCDTAHITTKRLIVKECGYKEITTSVPFSFVSQWETIKLTKVTKNDYGPYELRLYTKSGIFAIALSEEIDVLKLEKIIADVVFG